MKKQDVTTMSWATILEKTFDNFSMEKIHTALPAQVISFDKDKRTISAQITLKTVLIDDTELTIPILEDVPVIFQGSGDFELTFELKKDSYVLLVFSARALDQWFEQGGIVDPLRNRTFSLSDAIAIPGLMSKPDAEGTQPVTSDAIELRKKDGSTVISVKSDSIKLNNSNGTIELKSSGQIDCNSGTLTVDP